jgi:hypothetical protein
MRRLFFLTAASVFIIQFSVAQNAKYHSEIIFELAKHIEWSKQHSDYKFIVGIVGNRQDYYSFQTATLDGKLYNGYLVEVRYYNCTDDINSCDLIYISRDCKIDINRIIRKTRNESILIITGKEGYGDAGAIINFVDSGDKLSFELNQKQVKKRGLSVSDDLKSLATVI